MNWYEKIEEKKTLLVGGMLAICVSALVVTALRKPVAFDSFWHLQTGLDWIFKGLSPWIDHYSFTFTGKPIAGQPVAFQALLAWLVDGLGVEAGFFTIKLAAFIIAFGLMVLFLKKTKSPTIVFLTVLPLMVLLLELRATVRPELLSYSLSIVAVMLYHRARGRATFTNIMPIALLMFVWTNYHTSTLGYILFFGFFVDAAVLQWKERAGAKTWGTWFFGGLLVLLAGTINRGFYLPVIHSINFSPEFESFIQEYGSAALYKGVVGIYSLLVLVAVILVLALKQRKIGMLIVTLIFTYYSVRMLRLVTPCGIILLALLASLLSDFDFKGFFKRQSAAISGAFGIVIFTLILASSYSTVSLARGFMKENRTSALIRPGPIVNFMQEQGLSGRIFNEYGIGGYLIHELTPSSTVYIDGRTGILYPPSHLRRYRDALDKPEVLLEEIEKYEINLALLESDRRTFAVMQEAGALGLHFADHKFSLFVADNPNFPVSGKLLGSPACWQESDSAGLQNEFNYAILTLPGNSTLLPVLGFMLKFFNQPDRAAFLEEFSESDSGNEMQLRFAGYQALSMGMFQVSVDLLERIEIWEHREFLAAAIAYVNLGDWLNAEETINSMTNVLWPHINWEDSVLLYRLLETMRQKNGLSTIPDEFVDDLKNKIELNGESSTNLELDSALLCSPTMQ